VSYVEEDTCVQPSAPRSNIYPCDTCVSYEEEDTCVSYEEEDTCVSYEEEDTCVSLRVDLDQTHKCQKRPTVEAKET